MTSIPFDTLKFVRILRQAGFEEKQAEGIADALQAASADAELATKADIENLRNDLRRDLAETRADIIKWVVSAGVLQIALIASLVLALTK